MFSGEEGRRVEVKKCAVCGKLSEALHVCRACGRGVCVGCFEPVAGVCIECHRRLRVEAPSWSLPVKLFFLGFVLIFAGIILMMAAAWLYGASTVSGGAVIFIGPIPIMLGVGPHALLAILLATALTIVCLIFFLTLRKRVGKG